MNAVFSSPLSFHPYILSQCLWIPKVSNFFYYVFIAVERFEKYCNCFLNMFHVKSNLM